VATGAGDLVRIEIAPEAVDPDDVEMLQDLVVAAVNEALRNAREVEQEKLGGLAGGLGLPPGMI
jgi:DNA-binding protein YbaB